MLRVSRLIATFEAEGDNELSVGEGELVLSLGESHPSASPSDDDDDEVQQGGGWVHVLHVASLFQTVGGKDKPRSGFVPGRYLKEAEDDGCMRLAFAGVESCELFDAAAGDTVWAIKRDIESIESHGWVPVMHESGECGYVPASYVMWRAGRLQDEQACDAAAGEMGAGPAGAGSSLMSSLRRSSEMRPSQAGVRLESPSALGLAHVLRAGGQHALMPPSSRLTRARHAVSKKLSRAISARTLAPPRVLPPTRMACVVGDAPARSAQGGHSKPFQRKANLDSFETVSFQ
jgi:hypothetical protein